MVLAIGLAATAWAADQSAATPAGCTASATTCTAKPNTLTCCQAKAGQLLLFDGETTFGWKVEGDAKVVDGTLVIGGGKDTVARTTTQFGDFELAFQYSSDTAKDAKLVLNGRKYDLTAAKADGWVQAKWKVESKGGAYEVRPAFGAVGSELTTGEPVKQSGASLTPVEFHVPAGRKLVLRNVMLKPLGMKDLFNGKDLTGWKPVEGRQSVFSVTPDGELNVKNGGGELQSDWQGDDFVLQLDIISNGKHLNSGIFFRALRGQFWQGYESQIRNQWEGDDRTKPVDYGTGGIYNRQPTRKVIPSDGEWFTMTVIAQGPHIATWVNGYQCTDYVDEQADAPTARKGRYLGKGCIGIQGHDPTTDLSFKNIRVADLPKPLK